MTDKNVPVEVQLLDLSDGEEQRRVSVIAGASLAVIEVTRGPLTEVAYGAALHGHKILCGYEACSRVLKTAARAESLCAALAHFFAQDGAGDAALLSDLMDRFDAAGERYTYAAWSSDGNAVLRATGEA